MTRHEMVSNFGSSIEQERIQLKYSQKKMAEALDMSLSSYKRIINGETNNISIFTAYHMYGLTKKLGFELCGDVSPQLKVYNSLTRLSEAQLRFISAVIAPYRNRYGSLIDFGIRVTSDHLTPVYLPGDILLISKQPVRDGDTGIFIDKNSGLLYTRKFFQTSPCRLEPINNYGQTFYIDSSNESDVNRWIRFGFVITKMRT